MNKPSTMFDGAIPENYDRYLGPLLFTFTSKDIAERVDGNIKNDGKLLEIAAGTGITTEHLRKTLPASVSIVATDISEAMLKIAKEKRGTLENVTFEVADASALPYNDNTFDVVVCQFGLMFFPDKQKGLDEMFRVLKPGGKVYFNVWDSLKENKVVNVAKETIEKFFTEEPPKFLQVPFGFNDINHIKKLSQQAGFQSVESSIVQKEHTDIEAQNMARGFVTGNPTITELKARSTVDVDTAVEAVTEAIEKEFGKGKPKVTLQAIVFSAVKSETVEKETSAQATMQSSTSENKPKSTQHVEKEQKHSEPEVGGMTRSVKAFAAGIIIGALLTAIFI